MDRGLILRFGVVVSAAVLGWLVLWPTLNTWLPAPEWVQESFPGRIRPGIDIAGGARLTYEVEVDEYIIDQRDRLAENLVRQLGVPLGVYKKDDAAAATREQLSEVQAKVAVERVEERDIRVRLSDSNAAELNSEVAEAVDRDWLRDRGFGDLRVVDKNGLVVSLTMREEKLEELYKNAVQQAVRTVSDRVNNLGISEISVVPQENNIIVKIPEADEAQTNRIRGIISRTARLEFKIVDDEATLIRDLSDLPEGIAKNTESVLAGSDAQVASSFLSASGEGAYQRLESYIETLAPTIPDDHQMLLGKSDGGTSRGNDNEDSEEDGSAQAWRTYYVFRSTSVTGEDIDDASVSFDQTTGAPNVSIQFKASGAGKFGELTTTNVKRRMAIVLDDQPTSAPNIEEPITGGTCRITLGSRGGRNAILAEANDLVVVLKAGALPAPLRPANSQIMGPQLGEDSVTKGAQGALIGIALVLLFMALYYQVAGVIADIMVVLNLLLIMAILAFLDAGLTLPGIAALALTVGMAVDANVLITERIREELRLGKSPRSAVELGFKRGFSSVFDSQLTTFIAGVVLFQYGDDSLKGFAVMLMIGIATSLFTGIFCSKVLLDWLVRVVKVERLRVG